MLCTGKWVESPAVESSTRPLNSHNCSENYPKTKQTKKQSQCLAHAWLGDRNTTLMKPSHPTTLSNPDMNNHLIKELNKIFLCNVKAAMRAELNMSQPLSFPAFGFAGTIYVSTNKQYNNVILINILACQTAINASVFLAVTDLRVLRRTSRSGVASILSTSMARSWRIFSWLGTSRRASSRSSTISFTLLSLSFTISSM